jgi:hypothetical protein
MPHLEIRFDSTPALALAAVIAAALMAFWFYRTTVPPLPPFRRYSLLVLRGFTLTFLFLLLTEPVIRMVSTSSRRPVLVVIADISSSMTVRDRLGDRAATLRSLLVSSPMREIEQRADVRFLAMGRTTRPLSAEDLDSLPCTDPATDITAALESVTRTQGTTHPRAILLLSDGNPTLGRNPLHIASTFPLPVYTVGIGDTSEQQDLLVTRVTANTIVYAGSETPVDVRIKSAGFDGQQTEVALLDGSTVLDRKSFTVDGGTREYAIRLSYTPVTPGVRTFTVALAPLKGEVTVRNNRRSFVSRVRSGKQHMVILAGAPSADLAFLRQTLSENPGFSVSGYTQLPDGTFLDGPLSAAILDSADCLVLVGLPTASTTPATYDALQAALLKRRIPLFFVASRIVEWNRLEQYFHSTLPFIVETASATEQEVFVEPTPAERLSPVLTPPGGEGSPWTQLPPVYATRTTLRVKPGAVALGYARGLTAVTPAPLLLTLRMHGQRTVALTAYGIWRWRLMAQRAPVTSGFFGAFLTNVVQWLTAPEDRGPVIVKTVKDAFVAGEPIGFEGQVYDPQQHPLDDADVRVMVRHGAGTMETIFAAAGNGRYEGMVAGWGEEGAFPYVATATRGGIPVGSDSGTVRIGGVQQEFLETRMNAPLLRELAERTGGAFLHQEAFGRIGELLVRQPSFVSTEETEAAEYHLRNRPLPAAAIILLLALEWFLRKRSGMI